MSDKSKNILQKLKELFKAEEEKIEFATFNLEDGKTAITVDKLEQGGKVMLGDQTLAAGDYKLEDGTVITVDAAGMITNVVPAGQPPVNTPPVDAPVDMSTPEGMRKAYDKFATGSPEERLANIETLCKALMEYSFGWQLREAQEKANREAALKVYTDNLQTTKDQVAAAEKNMQAQKVLMSTMIELCESLVGEPNEPAPVTGKKKFSFARTDAKNKSLEKFQAAAAQLAKEQKEYEEKYLKVV